MDYPTPTSDTAKVEVTLRRNPPGAKAEKMRHANKGKETQWDVGYCSGRSTPSTSTGEDQEFGHVARAQTVVVGVGNCDPFH